MSDTKVNHFQLAGELELRAASINKVIADYSKNTTYAERQATGGQLLLDRLDVSQMAVFDAARVARRLHAADLVACNG